VNHKNWAKKGCVTTLPDSPGVQVRHELDRQSEEYKRIFRQRTASERINSQALELGIERPRLRNGQAIANINTLIYVLIQPPGLSSHSPTTPCARPLTPCPFISH